MSRGISGNRGRIVANSCLIAELTDFNYTYDKGNKTYNAVSGGGWQKTVLGNKKVSGTLKGKYDSDDPIDVALNTDSLVSLQLSFDTSPPQYFLGQARLHSLAFTVNVDTGDIEEWTCQFESDGAWAFS